MQKLELQQPRSTIESSQELVRFRAAHALYDAGCVSFHFESGIEHRSGIQAPIYINVRQVMGNPSAYAEMRGLLYQYALAVDLKPDVILGVATGGQWVSQVLAEFLLLPFGFVRPTAKDHGQKKQVEGCDVWGKEVLVVEDVVNLGTSSLPAVEAVRKEGGVVSEVLAIVTYGYTKTIEQFAEAGLRLRTLTTIPDIVEVGVARGVARGGLSRADADKVLQWLAEQDANNKNV
ncbi:MAG: phosphoribosyltransferase family protein [Patescibacteria group bacterium]